MPYSQMRSTEKTACDRVPFLRVYLPYLLSPATDSRRIRGMDASMIEAATTFIHMRPLEVLSVWRATHARHRGQHSLNIFLMQRCSCQSAQ
jgi:hypothetical protein